MIVIGKRRHYPLYLVTGAPGSGKSTTIQAFLALRSPYLAFDIDWLAETASNLAAKDIYTDPSTWQPYAALWFAVLHGVYQNGQIPLFFSPNDPQDLARFGQPTWCRAIHWLLLDCDDQTRRARLQQRSDWTAAMIDEALVDAQVLRQAIPQQVDTGLLAPNAVALAILAWLAEVHQG